AASLGSSLVGDGWQRTGRNGLLGVLHVLGTRLGLEMELAEYVGEVVVAGALGIINLGEVLADGGEEIIDVEKMQNLLGDGDKDEAQVVVEGPLEGVVLLGEAGVGGALLEEAGSDEGVDGRALEGGGAERPARGPEDEAAPREDE